MEGPVKIRSNLAGTITVLVNIRTRILLNSSYFIQSIPLTWTIYTALKTDASGTWYILVQITFIFSVQPPLITNQTRNIQTSNPFLLTLVSNWTETVQ